MLFEFKVCPMKLSKISYKCSYKYFPYRRICITNWSTVNGNEMLSSINVF